MDNTIIKDLISKSWKAVTHIPIQSIDSDTLTDSSELVIASVVFTGATQGSLTLATKESLAKKVASIMFDCTIETVSYDDIKDSIGELVNILAGNMKSKYFGDSDLSRPLVMEGDDSVLTMLGTDVVFQAVFSSEKDGQILFQVCHTQ